MMTDALRPRRSDLAGAALAAYPAGRSRRRYWRPLAALALPAVLASCHWGQTCSNCGSPTPTEISYGVAAADFNGDGFADVIQLSTVVPIPAPNQSNLKTYLSTSPSAFAPPTLTRAGTNPLYLVAADLNGDGFQDVVSASYADGTLSVFLNDKSSPGQFVTPLVLPSAGASQVAVGDVNGDGLPDLVSADFGVSLFLQASSGSYAAPVSLYSSGANWVAIGDLNDDGAADIALTDAIGVKLLMQTANGSGTSFAPAVSVFNQTPNANLTGANIIAIGDVDGDGLNDLVITDPGPTGGAGPTVNILIQDPSNHGSFLAPYSYPIATQNLALSIALVDLQGTGKLDIVIGESSAVTVLLHDPAAPGRFLAANIYSAPNANEIAVADVNGDGLPDIVVSNGTSQPTLNGIITTHPGVLLQSATSRGKFEALRDFP